METDPPCLIFGVFVVCFVIVIVGGSAYANGREEAAALVCAQYCDSTDTRYDFVENRCVCITTIEKFQGE